MAPIIEIQITDVFMYNRMGYLLYSDEDGDTKHRISAQHVYKSLLQLEQTEWSCANNEQGKTTAKR